MSRQLTTRGQLTLAFGALIALVLILAALSLNELSRANARFVSYVDGIATRAAIASQIRAAVDRRAIAARNLVLITDPSELALENADVQAAHADVQSLLVKLNALAEATDATEETRSRVATIARVENDYGPVALDIVRLAQNPNTRQLAIERMNKDCRPLLRALIAATDDFARYTSDTAAHKVMDSQSAYQSQKRWLLSLCLIACAGAIVAGTLIVRRLLRALGAEPATLRQLAERVASGDLSSIDTQGQPIEGSLMASLNAMRQSLSTIVGEVRDASNLISGASEQIAGGNSQISRRTEEQAAALEQTAATMSQLGTTVQRNTDSAQHARQRALETSAVATKGADVMSEVVSTMQTIQSSSRKIADITSVIDSIAFQTNILALNAAVEAARAGEQGLGFAVVAGEVRNLARRSAAAADEIKQLINASAAQVERGTDMVDHAGRTMNEILQAIQNVNEMISEITAASVEQSNGIGEVGHAVTQMDAAVKQNASIVETNSATANSLRDRATQLVDAVGVFKLAS